MCTQSRYTIIQSGAGRLKAQTALYSRFIPRDATVTLEKNILFLTNIEQLLSSALITYECFMAIYRNSYFVQLTRLR